jgi:hypothetical protein
MLRSVFPRAHQKYFSLPLLGPISDGLDNWLAASGFTQGSRKLSLNLLPIVDRKLHRLDIDEIAKLNHAVIDNCCKALKKRYPYRAGTVHTPQRYLVANGLIVDCRQAADQPSSLSGEYAEHLWRRPVSLLRLPAAPTPRRCATLRAAITAAAPGADEIAARSPSADSAGHAAVAPAGAAGRLAGQVGW